MKISKTGVGTYLFIVEGEVVYEMTFEELMDFALQIRFILTEDL